MYIKYIIKIKFGYDILHIEYKHKYKIALRIGWEGGGKTGSAHNIMCSRMEAFEFLRSLVVLALSKGRKCAALIMTFDIKYISVNGSVLGAY
jgi:hypothetical protein